MGGIGSGRSSRHLLVEHALVIDLIDVMRRGWVKDGKRGRVGVRFVHGGQRVQLSYDLTDPHEAWLKLNYRRTFYDGYAIDVGQRVPLTFTEPRFGGRRWWMICPHGGRRISKLYLPAAGDTFACREAWGLVYESQRRNPLERALARSARIERNRDRQQGFRDQKGV